MAISFSVSLILVALITTTSLPLTSALETPAPSQPPSLHVTRRPPPIASPPSSSLSPSQASPTPSPSPTSPLSPSQPSPTPSPSPSPSQASPTPSPSTSQVPPPPPLQPAPVAIQEKQFGNIIDALIGTGDFGGWANLLSSANPSFLPLTATLFIPCNDAISQLLSAATAGAQFDPLLIPYHIVPQRLTFSNLRKLAAHTRLPTLLPSKFIVITNSSTSNFTVDASQITQPDIFLNPAFALHGVTKILDYSVFNGGGSPVLPPSMSQTAGLSQWRKKLSPPGERSDARCSCTRIPVILWTLFAVLFISRFFEF